MYINDKTNRLYTLMVNTNNDLRSMREKGRSVILLETSLNLGTVYLNFSLLLNL